MNYSRSPIPQVDEKKKYYTARDVNKDDRASQLQHTTCQPVKQIINAVD